MELCLVHTVSSAPRTVPRIKKKFNKYFWMNEWRINHVAPTTVPGTSRVWKKYAYCICVTILLVTSPWYFFVWVSRLIYSKAQYLNSPAYVITTFSTRWPSKRSPGNPISFFLIFNGIAFYFFTCILFFKCLLTPLLIYNLHTIKFTHFKCKFNDF